MSFTDTPLPPTAILEQFETYPFDNDEAYKQGLQTILADGTLLAGRNDAEIEEIMRRSQVFYFNRIQGSAITVEDTRQYELELKETNPPADPSVEVDESRTLSFAELKTLIETGKVDQIPNNKLIPEAINEDSPSDSVAPSRKKPWETAVAQE